MECPRCGAGVGHTDNQCWRCGEMLKPAKAGESDQARSSGPAISAVKEGTTVIKRPLAPTVVRSLNDHNDAREKDLRGMEEELRKENGRSWTRTQKNWTRPSMNMRRRGSTSKEERISSRSRKRNLKEGPWPWVKLSNLLRGSSTVQDQGKRPRNP